jgi:hypothetical protein
MEDNFKMHPDEIQSKGLDWIDQAQYRDKWRLVTSTAMNIWVP